MKNLIKEYILATILTILMLVLICCASKPKEEIKEIPVPTIPGLEGVYFPSFPYPADGLVVPLDENNKAVTTDGIQIKAVVLPYWYWIQIVDYVSQTEKAVTALKSVANPP